MKASHLAVVADTCGLTMDGDIYCWGDNRSGQLGDGTKLRSDDPVKVVDPV